MTFQRKLLFGFLLMVLPALLVGAEAIRSNVLERRALDLPSGTRLALADSLTLADLDLPKDPAAAAAYAREHRPELAAVRARSAASTVRPASAATTSPARTACSSC